MEKTLGAGRTSISTGTWLVTVDLQVRYLKDAVCKGKEGLLAIEMKLVRSDGQRVSRSVMGLRQGPDAGRKFCLKPFQ